MKIISKFRDYYDGFADYTSDDPKVKYYIRKEEKVRISKYILQNLERELLRTPSDYKAAYLVIAGKVYPFISIEIPGKYKGEVYMDSHTKYYFDSESFMKQYNENRKKQDKARKYNGLPWYRWSWGHLSERDVNNFFNTNYSDMSDLCIEFDTPIILISPKSPGYKEREKTYRTCKVNVNLKKYGVSKVFKAPEMYQIIDVFVSNVLVKDEMPMSPMTDEEKIQSHGFDKKISFRKGKTKKK